MSNSKVKNGLVISVPVSSLKWDGEGQGPTKVMVPSFYILSLGPCMAQGVKIMCCESCLLRGRLLLHCNYNMGDIDKA